MSHRDLDLNYRTIASLQGFLPETSFLMAKRKHPQTPSAVLERVEPQSVGLIYFEGKTDSELVFVLEGKPFEGKAGQLLQKMVQAMGVTSNSVFMVSISRETTLEALQPHLQNAKVVIGLGEWVAQMLLRNQSPLEGLRAKLHPFLGVQLIATYTAQQLIDSASLKKEAWEDLKLAVKALGWKLPNKGQ